MGPIGTGKWRISVTGGTLSGNKGAAGMLESTIRNLGRISDRRIIFDILSVYPARDSKAELPPDSRLVPASPLVLVIVLPLAAILYRLLLSLRLPARRLLSFRLLESIANADLVVDISGISFVDRRYAALAYNIATILPALLTGTPVIKLSQAIGPVETSVNRWAATTLLDRCDMVFARGKRTYSNLESLGLRKVSEAPDLAFLLGEGEALPAPPVGLPVKGEGPPILGISPSQVLADQCREKGVDLVAVLSRSAIEIRKRTGCSIVILAHSHLGPGKRSRNNDYHICRELAGRIEAASEGDGPPDGLVLIDSDLTALELRSVISSFDAFIACRFHAMISALCVEVPCVVPSWSHKYGEVMSVFGQEDYIVGVEELSHERIASLAVSLLEKKDEAVDLISRALPAVREEAAAQFTYIIERLESISGAGGSIERGRLDPGQKAERLYGRYYSGELRSAWLGHAVDPAMRKTAASGGLVSTILSDMVESGRIDGAITAKIDCSGERLEFRTRLCRTSTEITANGSSIYSDFDHTGGITSILRRTEGRFAVVALPCQWKALDDFIDRNPDLPGTVALRIGLWCGHATGRGLVDDFLSIRGVAQEDIASFRYRRGIWRGESLIVKRSGAELTFPFSKGYGLYQNLYCDCMKRCFFCDDHFARHSDLSFGDAWLPELRSREVKESIAVSLTDEGRDAMRALEDSGRADIVSVAPALAVRAQKRAVIWHIYGSEARRRTSHMFGVRSSRRPDDPGDGTGRSIRPRWNDYISSMMMMASWKAFSGPMRPFLLRLPWPIHYPYLLAQKFFLNF